MRFRNCDSCKYMDGRDWRTIPAAGEIPAINVRNGWCHAGPPRVMAEGISSFPPVHLALGHCGVHSFGWRGFWRSVKRVFTREV
jgi:hypothetical protein